MNTDIRSVIDEATAGYFKQIATLFSTLGLFHEAIIEVATNKPLGMSRAYVELNDRLEKLHGNQHADFHNEVTMKHMPSLCFASLVSAFEEFLTELCVLALRTHPLKISGETVEFKKVIELTKEELIEFKAKEYLNQLMYKPPKEYLASLCKLLSVEQGSIKDDFDKYIEIKARRDLGIHNSWRKNEIYERKVREASLTIPAETNLIPSFEYFKESQETCARLVRQIVAQSCSKLFKVKSVLL